MVTVKGLRLEDIGAWASQAQGLTYRTHRAGLHQAADRKRVGIAEESLKCPRVSTLKREVGSR